MANYTFLSLFSGCGGLDLGLHEAGFRPILGLDSDPICHLSHQVNFPDVPFHCGSVTDLDLDLLQGLAKTNAETIDLLAGGPPCPPFSKSRFYRKDKPRALADHVGWETLNGYLNALATFQPRVFLLENVPGLAYRVHRDALDLILRTGQTLGYSVDWRILNAADFGVPQIRQRCFVVGVRGRRPFDWPAPTHAAPKADDLFAQHRPAWRTAGEVLSDLDDEAFSDHGHFAGGQFHDLLEQIPPGDNYLFFTAKRGHPKPRFEWRSRYWSFLLKLSPYLPAWTIQARRSNNMGPFHWRNRILRIAEIKRLQTFPDDWFLAGTIEHQWRQIGNAVPPLLAQHLGDAIARYLSYPEDIAQAS